MAPGLRIHDTLTGRKVEFEPRVPGHVGVYVCGPTVYEVPHLGHGRTAVSFDAIRRYLEWRGFDVTYVSNVTDVEDKIIARAASEGATEPEIAERFLEAYWHELDRLGVRRPDDAPRATEFIAPMQALVAELVAGGHAYVIEGEGVYFAVDSYSGYGELSGRRLPDLLAAAGARVEVDEHKRSPVDFALWKAAREGEPAWDSPWGPGRPGWHIECSAMSLAILGEEFDLHGGGDDLVFPHHENERAQAEAAGHPFARHWLHGGMVTAAGEKMSKSLGNFTTLAEALDTFGPRAFRLAVLQTHYRSQVELGDDVLRASAGGVDRLDALARRARSVPEVAALDGAAADRATAEEFHAAMDDDFGTPAAVGAIFRAVGEAHRAIDARDPGRAAPLVAAVAELTGVLGVGLRGAGAGATAGDLEPGEGAEPGASGLTAQAIEALVAERDAARRARDFATADRIRRDLGRAGVTLEDGATGTVWHR